MSPGFIPPHGGYEGLHSYPNVKALKVHDKVIYVLIIVFSVFMCLMARAESDQVKRLEADPLIDEGSPQRWALATDAIHSTSREAGLDRLRWGAATKANLEYVRKDLEQGPWRIRSRADVLESLKTTQTDGYSKMFWELGEYLSKLSEAERIAYAAKQGDDPKVLNRIKIATEQYPRLKDKGLLAWDLARCVALCRRAYTAGFLEREEAWSIIMPIAHKIQTVFDSWEDLGNNYLLGRQFWSKAYADRGNPALEVQFKKLLSDPSSVWHKLQWKLDLQQTAQTEVRNEAQGGVK